MYIYKDLQYPIPAQTRSFRHFQLQPSVQILPEASHIG